MEAKSLFTYMQKLLSCWQHFILHTCWQSASEPLLGSLVSPSSNFLDVKNHALLPTNHIETADLGFQKVFNSSSFPAIFTKVLLAVLLPKLSNT